MFTALLTVDSCTGKHRSLSVVLRHYDFVTIRMTTHAQSALLMQSTSEMAMEHLLWLSCCDALLQLCLVLICTVTHQVRGRYE